MVEQKAIGKSQKYETEGDTIEQSIIVGTESMVPDSAKGNSSKMAPTLLIQIMMRLSHTLKM